MKHNARLIATCVNACAAVNPENPAAVAGALETLVATCMNAVEVMRQAAQRVDDECLAKALNACVWQCKAVLAKARRTEASDE